MVEVLDHYHGPYARKLWLIAFAESANDRTRTGWSPRWKLAHRSDITPISATRVARALIGEGVIKRHGGGYRGQAAVYELLPLDGKGVPGDTHSGPKGYPPTPRKGIPPRRKGVPPDTPSLSSPQDHPSSARARDRAPREHLDGRGSPGTETDRAIAELTTRAETGDLDPALAARAQTALAKLRGNGERTRNDNPERANLGLAPPESTP